MEIYKTIVKAIGREASVFKDENMLILFGEDAPDSLKEYCFIIEVMPLKQGIQAGMNFVIGKQSYTITAVGNVVSKNLTDLGHITIKFDGALMASLPGTIHLEAGGYPQIDVETLLKIEKGVE